MSPTHSTRLAATCGTCHADPDLASSSGVRLVQPLAAYSASVHARAVEAGEDGARCSSCHGAHEILPAADPESRVNRAHIVETCGRCHEDIAHAFEASVHGKAAAHGIQDSPVCTDCHGEHRILGPLQQDSPVYATNIPKLTCGRCHGDVRLSEKFGVADDKVLAYSDSFHGLASRSGSLTVANCSSCHGVHDILPSTDPEAHTNSDNLAETCGQCHPGAGSRFAIGPVHTMRTQQEHPAVFWVRSVYLVVIVMTIGAMLLHNLLDLYRKAQRRPLADRVQSAIQTQRMSLGFRAAHALLAVSFIVLAYTGFALKYPESWWAAPLLRWESSFGLRGWIHRAAAVAMLGAAVLHGAHLIVDRRARRCVAGMRPGRADWVELKARIAYLLGRRGTTPTEPWLGYPEKAEYWAVLWGTMIMAGTGFVLWFESLTLRWLPSWIADLATAVHFYEAVLATLAILVWHFYAVVFDPTVYPMDMAWLTGRSARPREPEPEPKPKPGDRESRNRRESKSRRG
jgi:cytochrome b subunit of formate dehydrogenase